MSKIAIAFLAVASLAACGGKKNEADNQKHIDAVCLCKDQACVDEYMNKNPDAAKIDDPKLKECKDKAMAGAMAGEGSAMAPSGGEGSAMAPSGGEGGAAAPSGGEGGAMAPSGGEGSAMAPSGGEGSAMAPSGGEGSAMAPSGGAAAGSAN